MSVPTPEQRLARLRVLKARVDGELYDLEKRLGVTVTGPRRRRAQALCGTDSGYYRHLRKHHTEPCEACRAAHAEVERARRRRREASLTDSPTQPGRETHTARRTA